MDSTMNTGGGVNSRPVGPTIGLIVILIIIVIGGIYFWTSRTTLAPQNTSDQQDQTGSSTQEIMNQGSSDDMTSIEADLNAFGESDINSADSGL